MGHRHSKNKLEATIGSSFTCPKCQILFEPNTLTQDVNQHIINCSHTEPSHNPNDLCKSYSFSNKHFKKNKRKTEINAIRIKDYIKSKKINWMEGCDNLVLSREKCLEESLEKIEFVDLWRELKISFNGEVSYDAGGLYREWFIILIEELEKKEMKLFQKSDSDDFTFIFDRNLNEESFWSFKYFIFIGKLIAKSLIDNITINLSFNILIFKLILEEEIRFEDLKNIDTFLYSSLLSLKNMTPEELSSMEIYYIYQYEDENGNLITDELVESGENKKVTNIDDYIEKRINYMTKKAKVLINYIQEGLFTFIPKNVIKSLNSFEFELLVCGQPFIDVNEWKQNTIYRGKFSKNHYCVQWFWDEIYHLSQNDLRKFFQFSTGSSRVPINGFKNLESNRGEIAKYCLNPVPYNKKGNNYIKAHTCFNRLDVPLFLKREEIHEAIELVLKNITGFGID